MTLYVTIRSIHEITKEEALEHYISMDKAFLFRNVIYDDFFSCCKAYDISPIL